MKITESKSRKNEKKGKHLTLDDRIEIQERLAKGMTFKAIGLLLENKTATEASDKTRNLKTKLKAA